MPIRVLKQERPFNRPLQSRKAVNKCSAAVTFFLQIPQTRSPDPPSGGVAEIAETSLVLRACLGFSYQRWIEKVTQP